MKKTLLYILATVALMSVPAFGQEDTSVTGWIRKQASLFRERRQLLDSLKTVQGNPDLPAPVELLPQKPKQNPTPSPVVPKVEKKEESLFLYEGLKPLGENQKILEGQVLEWARLYGFTAEKVEVDFFGGMSKGGTLDAPLSETNRFLDSIDAIREDSLTFDLFLGASDSTRWDPKLFPGKIHFQEDVALGNSRQTLLWIQSAKGGVFGHFLQPNLRNDRRGVYHLRAKVKPREKTQTTVVNNSYKIDSSKTIINNYPVVGSSWRWGFGLGVVGHPGHIRALLPAALAFIKKGDVTVSFSFGYWENGGEGLYWMSSSLEVAYAPLHIDDFRLGVALGGHTLNENNLLTGHHLEQEMGLLVGLRPSIDFDEHFSLEGVADMSWDNFSAKGAEGNKVENNFSVALFFVYSF